MLFGAPESSHLRHAEVVPGWILNVLLPTAWPSFACQAYHHTVWFLRAAVYTRRLSIWQRLDALITGTPNPHLLVVGGDMNTGLQSHAGLVGSGLPPPTVFLFRINRSFKGFSWHMGFVR